MSQIRLGTLLIVLALGPPVLAGPGEVWRSGRIQWNDWAIIIDANPPLDRFRQ